MIQDYLSEHALLVLTVTGAGILWNLSFVLYFME